MAGKSFGMNADKADHQVKRLEECFEMLEQSRQTMADLGKEQTSTLWTADGKSVVLTAELRAKYRAAQLWLAAISKDIEEARINLQKAVDETDAMDDAQKADFQKALYRVVGSPMKPIAI
ncbi:hypothetical protein [Microbacterium sp. NPDC058345]|uniref:hypothetical protein n=1 Tax=Microbacterium sp. NPDC058345 TaxID=3346455 RepID=UPI00365840B4